MTEARKGSRWKKKCDFPHVQAFFLLNHTSHFDPMRCTILNLGWSVELFNIVSQYFIIEILICCNVGVVPFIFLFYFDAH